MLIQLSDPDAIPLNSLGVVDVAAAEVNENEVLAHALANLSRSEKELGWAIRHSSDFVNEYPRTNPDGSRSDGGTENPAHLLGSFPCLFPYGKGGFEVKRPQSVTYEVHARWAIRYADRRFSRDLHFIFQVFGVLQKRQLCAAAVLQISRRVFTRYEHEIWNLPPSAFVTAAAEEQARKPFSNKAMQSLRRNLTSIRAKVMGTDESRIKIRSMIWGMIVKSGPPSIWLTINPTDTQDPVAQVLCGCDIDLDKFVATDHQLSDVAIASDPHASASFFHIMVRAVLGGLLGITGFHWNEHIKREKGILGTVHGYVGTVEAQGRGTLHLHMLLWLKGASDSDSMKVLLNSDAFREKARLFISANVHADIEGKDGALILAIPRRSKVAFSRPIDPRNPTYDDDKKIAVRDLARTVQVHQCGQSCLRYTNARTFCKRRTPFPLAEDAWINAEGDWGPKRLYGYLNNWNPEILQSLRANHDIKVLTNGAETRLIAWYITQYIAKKQHASFNISALLANTLAFHRDKERTNHDLNTVNKRMIQCCANTLSREQELSGPEVISYLMGWGDRYISHHFETVPLFPLLKLLRATFPLLNTK